MRSHNPLSLKSYKIGSPMKNFQKLKFSLWTSDVLNFQRTIMIYSCLYDDLTLHSLLKVQKICGPNWKFQFLKNFLRGPYLIGFQTKWIMTPHRSYHHAIMSFFMFLSSSLDFWLAYCAHLWLQSKAFYRHQQWMVGMDLVEEGNLYWCHKPVAQNYIDRGGCHFIK